MANQNTQRDQTQQKDFPSSREEQVRGIADTEVDDDADEDFEEDDELDDEEEDSEGAM